VSQERTDFAGIKEELRTIGIALSVLAISQAGAANADQRKRHEAASRKALDLLLMRIEAH
jgi:hypothetical protein